MRFSIKDSTLYLPDGKTEFPTKYLQRFNSWSEGEVAVEFRDGRVKNINKLRGMSFILDDGFIKRTLRCMRTDDYRHEPRMVLEDVDNLEFMEGFEFWKAHWNEIQWHDHNNKCNHDNCVWCPKCTCRGGCMRHQPICLTIAAIFLAIGGWMLFFVSHRWLPLGMFPMFGFVMAMVAAFQDNSGGYA